MTWTSLAGRVPARARRLGARWGIQAGIVIVGGVLAAGSLHGTAYLQKAPVVERVVASASTPRFAIAPVVEAVGKGSTLDAGLQHASIDRWVKKLATPQFASLLDRKAKYEPMITAKLDSAGMPRDLIYLAMIESEFNPNAKSPVKAVGMWQFMAGTARQFGLRVRGSTDERRNPARSTDAALTYLAALKDRLGSWYLAAAAYNSGEGTVRKALRTVTGQTTGTDSDFFRIMPVLPKETRDYVPKLIAASRVGNAPSQYGITVSEDAGEVTPVVPAVETRTAVTPASHGKARSSRTVHRAKSSVRSTKRKASSTRRKASTSRRSTVRKTTTGHHRRSR